MRLKSVVFLFLLSVAFVLNAQTDTLSAYDKMLAETYENTVPLMQPKVLYQKLSAGEKVYILDTRGSREYEVSIIQGAIHVGYLFFSENRVEDVKKTDLIVVYCTIGARSESIGEKLIASGYNNVYNLYGGIIQWKNLGYPVYHKGKKTEKVHVFSKKWGEWLTNGKPVY